MKKIKKLLDEYRFPGFRPLAAVKGKFGDNSDLEKHRPIWFGGKDRKEESMDEFYAHIGEKASKSIELAVNGYVEAVLEISYKKCVPCSHTARQIPYHETLGRCLGQIAETGIFQARRP